jgi:hypothetical protein
VRRSIGLKAVPRIVTVELDATAEAALDLLTAAGRSLDEAVRLALVTTARSAADAQAAGDERDDVIGLA